MARVVWHGAEKCVKMAQNKNNNIIIIIIMSKLPDPERSDEIGLAVRNRRNEGLRREPELGLPDPLAAQSQSQSQPPPQSQPSHSHGQSQSRSKSRESHSTATAQPQHSHSAVPRQPQRRLTALLTIHSITSGSSVGLKRSNRTGQAQSAQSQHRHSTVTAQSQHSQQRRPEAVKPDRHIFRLQAPRQP